ncbi:hypothetical protein J6590_058520 [Homalodisca vitripennis]|nr:hypothetical protein J6590_058520 [Homalodisca vitripennis]
MILLYVSAHTVEFDENEAFLSVPPLDLMDHIVGYETISFDAMCVPPPPASRLVLDQEQEYCSIETQHPTLTEQQVRQALMIHIAKHSCYGHDAAKTQVITALQASSAFHGIYYLLRTSLIPQELAQTGLLQVKLPQERVRVGWRLFPTACPSPYHRPTPLLAAQMTLRYPLQCHQ